jgi:hypothetical protein
VCAVRSRLRHRESLVQMAAPHVNHMPKALDQMNLQLHHVISDITGQTGLAIVDAILSGERNPQVLAELRHERIKASAEVIAKSLVGDYRPEPLFTLQQSLLAYRSYQQLIADCDREIRRALETFHPPDSTQASGERQCRLAAAQEAIRRRSLAVGIAACLRRRSHPNSGNPHRHRANPFRRGRPGFQQVPECLRLCLLDGPMSG